MYSLNMSKWGKRESRELVGWLGGPDLGGQGKTLGTARHGPGKQKRGHFYLGLSSYFWTSHPSLSVHLKSHHCYGPWLVHKLVWNLSLST